MLRQIVPAIRMVLVLTVLTGIGYPLLVTVLCQAMFRRAADGSMLTRNGQLIGSELIGQEAGSPKYFHSRPSAAGNGYDAMSSSGSNLGPASQKLADRVRAAAAQFRSENPNYKGPIPADLLTASGSGLDPDISPASAYAQSERIAGLRGIPKTQVDELIKSRIDMPTLGIIGEERVNVLLLNLQLDQIRKP